MKELKILEECNQEKLQSLTAIIINGKKFDINTVLNAEEMITNVQGMGELKTYNSDSTDVHIISIENMRLYYDNFKLVNIVIRDEFSGKLDFKVEEDNDNIIGIQDLMHLMFMLYSTQLSYYTIQSLSQKFSLFHLVKEYEKFKVFIGIQKDISVLEFRYNR